MKNRSTRLGRAIAVRIDKGEEVISALERACIENGVKTGIVSGVGALSKCTLYSSGSVEVLEPIKIELMESMEIASATGNVTTKDGKPFVHLHAVLGRTDHSSIAGHLLNGVVSLTGEFFIIELSGEIGRKEHPAQKMNLVDL